MTYKHLKFLYFSIGIVAIIYFTILEGSPVAQGEIPSSIKETYGSEGKLPPSIKSQQFPGEVGQVNQIVTVNPGDDIQRLVDKSPEGTTFLINAGVHRFQKVERLKNGDRFIGTKGAILSGAKLLAGFIQEGKHWVVTGQKQEKRTHGECTRKFKKGYEGCQFAQDIFINDVPLIQVTSLTDLKTNEWFFDFDHDKIYLADNPLNQKVEISDTPFAFSGASENVTIRGLAIQKYANSAQFGAIHNYGTDTQVGKKWVIEDNEISLNHGIGVRVDEGALVKNNYIHHNGQLGIAGSGKGIVIEDNEIAYNNTQGFNFYWEAGGTKFVRTQDLIVRRNFSHHNKGPGLWTDGDNIYTVYEDNRVLNNETSGIFHEISYDAIIKGNQVEGNGFAIGWYSGAGILIASSPNVEVKENVVSNNANGIVAIQQNRGRGPQGPYEVKNLNVHDNLISMDVGASGVALDPGATPFSKSNGNTFTHNTYKLGNEKNYFVWLEKALTKEEWLEQGQDSTGKFHPK
jgi:parallel beta-helix repeat protein